jgi:pimeloyl-ACP methyl ester carboxylesterase
MLSTITGGLPLHKPTVIAMHCSGSTGRQWTKLAQALGDRFNLIAPDLIGCGATPFWSGERRFRLADEAAPIIEVVDALGGPVHLVGHSYGGGVAMRLARERPHRVASLSLYEPTAFHVLRLMGPDGHAALAEIRTVAGDVIQSVLFGDYQGASRRFVDYWNHTGMWDSIKPESRAELIRYVRKAPLEFGALIEEPTSLVAFRRLTVPVLLMRGERTPMPAALVARKLFAVFRSAAMETVSGAGHMGPFSHADVVSGMIAAHIAAVAGIRLASDSRAASLASPARNENLIQPGGGRAVA